MYVVTKAKYVTVSLKKLLGYRFCWLIEMLKCELSFEEQLSVM